MIKTKILLLIFYEGPSSKEQHTVWEEEKSSSSHGVRPISFPGNIQPWGSCPESKEPRRKTEALWMAPNLKSLSSK